MLKERQKEETKWKEGMDVEMTNIKRRCYAKIFQTFALQNFSCQNLGAVSVPFQQLGFHFNPVVRKGKQKLKFPSNILGLRIWNWRLKKYGTPAWNLSPLGQIHLSFLWAITIYSWALSTLAGSFQGYQQVGQNLRPQSKEFISKSGCWFRLVL